MLKIIMHIYVDVRDYYDWVREVGTTVEAHYMSICTVMVHTFYIVCP